VNDLGLGVATYSQVKPLGGSLAKSKVGAKIKIGQIDFQLVQKVKEKLESPSCSFATHGCRIGDIHTLLSFPIGGFLVELDSHGQFHTWSAPTQHRREASRLGISSTLSLFLRHDRADLHWQHLLFAFEPLTLALAALARRSRSSKQRL
jgi:hypothetical protein